MRFREPLKTAAGGTIAAAAALLAAHHFSIIADSHRSTASPRQSVSVPAEARSRTLRALDAVPLAFERAEAPARSGYIVRAYGTSAEVGRTGVLIGGSDGTSSIDHRSTSTSAPVRIVFGGSQEKGTVELVERLPGYVNYLIGTDRSRWRTHVATYARVRAQDVYPGIDVEYYGTGRHLEYDFIVSPGSDPSAIRLSIDAPGQPAVTSDGDIAVAGTIVQKRPVAYQDVGGARRLVPASYVRRDKGEFGIDVRDFDSRLPVVIDPVVLYSFSTGGSATEAAADIAVDATGAAYVAGTTDSPNFPATHAYQPGFTAACGPSPFPCSDGFILKLNRAGNAIEWATYLGGSLWDYLYQIRVDASGNSYVRGLAVSTDFPGAADGAFVAKLSADGSQLLYVHQPALRFGDLSAELLDMTVSPSGDAYLLVRRMYGECQGLISADVTAEKVAAGGGAATLLFGQTFCAAPFNEFRIGVGPDGDIYVTGLEATITRRKPNGAFVYLTRIDPPDSLWIALDGSAVVGWTAAGTVQVIAPAGELQTGAIPLPRQPEWTDITGPFVGTDGASGVRATLCGTWTAPAPGSRCITSSMTLAGAVQRSDAVDFAAAFTSDASGWLYSAGGTPDIAVRKYSFVTLDQLTSNLATATYGTPITWTAAATPAAGLEYSFWRFDSGRGWSLAQPYGPSKTYTWTPSYGDIGAHDVQVWVRHTSAAHAYEAWLGAHVDVTNTAPPSLDSVVASANPVASGSPVTFTASAHGGTAPLQYQFWRLDNDGWHLAQDYSASNTYTYTPTAADAGSHAIQVWVRNAGSLASYESYTGTSFTVSGPAPLSVTRLNGPTGTLASGTPLTWTAETTGGIAPLQYQFWRLDPNGWHLAQAYGPSPSYTYTPTAADAGSHAIQVWVRNAGSSTAYDAWTGLTFDVAGPAPLVVTALTANGPPSLGVPVTWTATATGGVGPLQFQFWRLDNDGWHLAQDYSPSASYTWTPTPGTHAIQVWVRSAGSLAAYDAWFGTGVFLL